METNYTINTIEDLTNIDKVLTESNAYITKCDLYLTSWEYKATFMINTLVDLVEQQGGRVSYKYHDYKLIGNRRYYDIQFDANKKLLNLKNGQWIINKPDRALRAANKYLDEFKDGIKLFNNSVVNMREGHWIKFKLNNYIYSFDFDENPFFPHYYSKNQIVNNNQYNNNYYLDELKGACPDWAFDSNVPDDNIKEWAQILLNKLIESAPSAKVYEKKRVPNYYDNGYHYEQIHKTNMIKIDF